MRPVEKTEEVLVDTAEGTSRRDIIKRISGVIG